MPPDTDPVVHMTRPHWRQLSVEALRFLAVGATNTLATFVLYWLLLRIIAYPLAYTASFIAGIGISYLLNTLLVFNTKPGIRSALAFPLVYLAQYLVGLVVLLIFSSRLVLPSAHGVLVVAAITLPMTFLLSRFVLRRLQ